MKAKDLKVGMVQKPRGPIEVYGIADLSKNHARDDRYGPLETYDGRKVYMPEVGQRERPLPSSWARDPEGLLKQEITLKQGEWANLVMMPSVATLIAHDGLTKNFRNTLVQVVYDALRYKLKPIAIKAAKKGIAKETKERYNSPEQTSSEPDDPEPALSNRHTS